MRQGILARINVIGIGTGHTAVQPPMQFTNAKQHRKGIYDFVEQISGYKMHPVQAEELKKLLIGYVDFQVRHSPNVATHLFICQGCFDVKEGYGRTFKKRYKNIEKWQQRQNPPKQT